MQAGSTKKNLPTKRNEKREKKRQAQSDGAKAKTVVVPPLDLDLVSAHDWT